MSFSHSHTMIVPAVWYRNGLSSLFCTRKFGSIATGGTSTTRATFILDWEGGRGREGDKEEGRRERGREGGREGGRERESTEREKESCDLEHTVRLLRYWSVCTTLSSALVASRGSQIESASFTIPPSVEISQIHVRTCTIYTCTPPLVHTHTHTHIQTQTHTQTIFTCTSQNSYLSQSICSMGNESVHVHVITV